MTWRTDGDTGVVAGMSILNVVGSDVAENVQLVQADLGRIVQVVSDSTLRTRQGFCVTQQTSFAFKYVRANC